MKTAKISSLLLGNEEPLKICVPLVGSDEVALLKEAQDAVAANIDIVEWRLDFFDTQLSKIKLDSLLCELVAVLNGIPLLVTLRTKGDGGEFQQSWAEYASIIEYLIKSQYVDCVDIEFNCPMSQRDQLLGLAKKQHKPIILSYHDFKQVPEFVQLTKILDQLTYLNPDVIKMAFYVKKEEELLRLRVLKEQWLIEAPFILIGMGELGQETRLNMDGVLTYGTLSGKSAPGQVSVSEIRKQLN